MLSVVARLLRTVIAFTFIAALWGAIGFGFLSAPVGLAFTAWSLIVGPAVIVLTVWLFRGPIFHIRKLSFRKQAGLQNEYLECLLKNPSLNLRIWVRESDDLGFFWWEEGLFGRSRTHLVVTTQWLKESPENKAVDFRALWMRIATMPLALRRLRSFQIILWWGPASLLDLILLVLRSLLDALNFTEFPGPSFWMQRLAWFMSALCFGSQPEGELLPRVGTDHRVSVPRSWNWVSFGIWVLYPARMVHPTWMLFTSSQAFLDTSDEASSS